MFDYTKYQVANIPLVMFGMAGVTTGLIAYLTLKQSGKSLPKLPTAADLPKMPEMPKMSDLPKMHKMPDLPKMPEMPKFGADTTSDEKPVDAAKPTTGGRSKTYRRNHKNKSNRRKHKK